MNIKKLMPDSWEECTLKDIGEIINGDRGKNYPSRAHYLPSGIPFISAGNIENNFIDVSSLNYISEQKFNALGNGKLRPKDIIYCLRGSLGKCAIFNLEKGAISSSLCILRPKDDVMPKFVYYFLNSPFGRAEILKHDNGTAQPNLSAKNFANYKIRKPSIAEQQQIVSKIEALFSELDKSIEQLKTAQQQLKVYRQSVLKCAFEGKLTYDWRINNDNIPSVEEYLKKSSSNEFSFESNEGLPKSWRRIRLNYLCERVSVGHVGPTSQFYSSKETGIPFLRSQNVRKGYLDFEGLQYINKEFHKQLKKSQLQVGDLLIVRVGANRGDACIVPDNIGEINCANIVFARPHKGISDFLGYFFLSPFWTDLIEKVTTGSAQGVVNTKIVAETIVNFPPIQEQTQIIYEIEKQLSVADNLGETITNNLQQAEVLRQSILKKAFEEKLKN